MNLHIPTLFVMIMVVTATMALAIAVSARRRYRELMAWSVGLALQVVAYALLSLRGQIPDFWSIVVGNMAITGTLAMYAVGQLRFLGRPVSHWIVSLPITVAFAGFYLFIHRFEERLLLSSSLLLAQNIFNLVILIRDRRDIVGRGQYLLMTAGGIISVLMMLRIFSILTGIHPPTTLTDAAAATQTGSFVATLICTVLMTIGVLMMTQERAEAKLATSEAKYRKLIDSASEGICVVEGGCLRFVNPKLLELLGYAEIDLIDQPFLRFIHPDSHQDAQTIHHRRLQGQAEQLAYSIQVIPRNGGSRWLEVRGVLFDWHERPATLNFLTDITDRRVRDEMIREQAFHDALTQLPNRRLLLDHLNLSIANNQRSGRFSAVVFIDLDNFKPLNDRYGHNVGDLLLIEVGDRLRQQIRVTDTAARLGGDEFVVLINNLESDAGTAAQQACQFAQKLVLKLSQPYELQINQNDPTQLASHHCTASAGVALVSGQRGEAAKMLDQADAAMYQAKKAGRNQVMLAPISPA